MNMVYSFDVFDTAVIRLVSRPKDVFTIIEKKIDKEYSLESNFAKNRVLAEEKAREKSRFEEVTLEEIYREMEITDVDLNVIRKMEVSTEVDLCRANQEIFEFYNGLINEGYRIVFTSDMYLNSEEVGSILRKCGYLEYEKVYTSSDARCTKRTGKLFAYVINDLKIRPYELIHIGDNYKSDYISSKLRFVRSRQYKQKKYFYHEEISNSIIRRTAMQGSGLDSFGYSVMGPFAFGFVDWIHRNTTYKDKIFFLSRDGYLLKEIYDSLFPTENTFYLRVSRKALRNALMSNIKCFADYCNRIPPFDKYDGFMLMDLLGLSMDDLRLNSFDKFEELGTFVAWKEVPYSTLFETLYLLSKEILRKEYEIQGLYLYKYLLDSDIKGNIAVVDLSFKGTAFNLLKDFCENNNIDVQMEGYVIGKSELMEKRIGGSADLIHGWIFENECNNPLAKVLISAATLYERFLFDSCGTTLSYKMNNENGMVYPVLAEDEERQNIGTIEKERDNILKFVDEVRPYYKLFESPVDGNVAVSPLVNYFMFPKEANVSEIGDMVEDNTIVRYIAKPDCIRNYIIKPKKMILDFSTSFWKQGFLYRLFHSRLIIKVFNYLYFKKKGIHRKERVLFYNKLK